MSFSVPFCYCQRTSDFDPHIHSIKEKLTWCVISQAEINKCKDWSEAMRRTRTFEFDFDCIAATDKDQCMNFIENGQATMVTLDPGEVFVAGRYHSLVPIMSEQYGSQRESGYYSVAVVKRESSGYIKEIKDLRGRKVCFTGVGHMAGWVIPMARLLDEERLLEIRDCNNMIKSAASFFGPSCAPNSLIDKYNPTGDNPESMCALCRVGEEGKSINYCSGSDRYANFEGAFRCLTVDGDIAFLKHTTVDQMIRRNMFGTAVSRNNFELLCPNGGRANVDQFTTCNWGYVPAHAVVVSSATLPEKRFKIQKFLQESIDRFSFVSDLRTTTFRPGRFGNQFQVTRSPFDQRFNNITSFSLFGDSFTKYGAVNLLFADETTSLIPVEPSKQTFTGYLGSHSTFGIGGRTTSFLSYFEKLRKCPVASAALCVISEKEVEKCNKMKTAFRAQMLKPELSCVKAHSAIGCMQLIYEGYADLAVLDAGDIFRGGQDYQIEPILAEQYSINETSYYVVAIAKQSDKDTDLLYLKGKRSCHSGYGLASGWVIPLSFLLSNGRMRPYGCDSTRAASEFFQKSCAPGALSREFTGHGNIWEYGNLCDLCHGESYRFCSRDSSEPFYGDTGALRCLVEGGGEIAFARHTTIFHNTAGRNPQWWARNVIPNDFELLCRDGTRNFFSDYRNCNLGKVSSNAIVTHRKKDDFHKDAYINLFLYAQQFYGSKYSEDFTFKMFVSEENYHNLIFQDATQQLKAIPKYKRNYGAYLGHDFIKAMTIVDCNARLKITDTSTHNIPSFTAILFVCIVILMH